ncbi:hypothetical protein [Legionella worsleiensis]|uniref:Uncharacterized protein n=1 Tax=Legionella worsleiensis TaxID=45076 RepID=A0A0W1AA45_9GAMM|nr:hypothetical protein [Legionella worsleiensis]KTD78236.1 hypothetical protein Lwor_1631 [Legionella worsleiensis]STY32573.1 Uncharacterised protein [Legionella worsleiensis]
MMKITLRVGIFLGIFTNFCWAGDFWTTNITPQAVAVTYPGSPIRNNLNTEGALVDFQYLERLGISIGETHLNLNYKFDIPALNQDIGYFSIRTPLTPDYLDGILTLRLDTYKIWGNDPTRETDNTSIIAPIVSFLNYKQTYYLDFGYAYSKYGTSAIRNDNLSITQVTPTVGFSFFEQMNWIYLRLYSINSSNPIRSQNLNNTLGTEITLTHYIMPSHFFVPQVLQAGLFLGKRIYAVDNIALIPYNLGDVQKNSAYVQAKWKLTQHLFFILNGGSQNFNTLYNNANYSYKLNYIYGGLNFKF